MIRSRLPQPSAKLATGLAFVALMVALGGTTYAALKLPKNSVGSKQLKKNSVTGAKIKKDAVTGAKVKDGSLSGKDINLAQLGTVPSAQTANSLAAPEPVHLVGAPGEPGFENGSSNLGGFAGINLKPVGFFKDHDGVVHLQGFATLGISGSIGAIFSLPPGFRPANGQVAIFNAFCIPVAGGKCESDSEGDTNEYDSVAVTGANVSIGPIVLNGAVASAPGTGISLDGITFRAEG